MKKFLSILLAVVMAFGCVGTVFAETVGGSENDIRIVYTNDIHCSYEKYDKVATLAKDADILIDGGDAIEGDLIGTVSKGEYVIDIMNQLEYDVAGLGNHEFDYGIDLLKSYDKQSKYSYVCCNFIDLKTKELVFEPYKVVNVNDKKIAFVGVVTPASLSQANPAIFKDALGNYIYSFCEGNKGQDLYDQVQKYVDEASEKADYVVLIAHLGIAEQNKPWTSKELIENVTGVDAIFDGHSHSVYFDTYVDKSGKEVPAIQTGTKLENVAEISIKEDGSITATNIALDDVAGDKDTKTFLDSITSKVSVLKDKVVAKSLVDLSIMFNGVRAVRNSETAIGDLCADACRKVAGADVAILNGGAIRADINADVITSGDIIGVHPYNKKLCLVEVSGQQIKDALEMGCSMMPNENGGFLQVSGLTFTCDATIPSSVVKDDAGAFVKVLGEYRVRDIMIGGKPIELNQTYTLASHDYILKTMGDGYAMFGLDNIKILRDEIMNDNEALLTYIVDNLGGVIRDQYAQPQGRMKFIIDAKECKKNLSCSLSSYYDLDLTKWYHDGIHFCLDEGIMNGIGNAVFNPNGNCTRGMLAAILYRVEGSPETEVTTMFTDIRGSEYYAKAVSWAFNNNVVNGLEPHTFGGNMNITREQFATMLYNYAKLDGEGFVGDWYFMLDYQDASQIHSWADEAMHWCVMKKILNGKSETILDPQGLLTRAEAAAMIQRYCYLQ